MVDAFHAQGIKVYCDFVFNHGGEGDVDALTGTIGKIFSCRGLDNATYYEVQDSNDRYAGVPNQVPPVSSPGHFYRNDNGVSGNLNCANPTVRNLIIDALQYWHQELGVDGFRFDLAAVLGNTQTRNGFTFSATDPNNPLEPRGRRAARPSRSRRSRRGPHRRALHRGDGLQPGRLPPGLVGMEYELSRHLPHFPEQTGSPERHPRPARDPLCRFTGSLRQPEPLGLRQFPHLSRWFFPP
ncbi:MAG: alpha-amylase family glycosyl hydrolase [Chthoniobacteraceae bacterium]